MPKPDTNIDTAQLGLALKFNSPGKHAGPRGSWRVEFDTGIVIFAPAPLFSGLIFHLAEKD